MLVLQYGHTRIRRPRPPHWFYTVILLLICLYQSHRSEASDVSSNNRSGNEQEIDGLPVRYAVTLPPAFESSCRCSPSVAPDSDTIKRSRILYLITVHNERTIQDALHLFRAIRSPRNIILIHIDTKCDFQVYENSTLYQEIQACPCGSTVQVESIHSAEWSKWSMNLPTLWGMKLAVTQYKNAWDVWINLSGDTLPVYTADVLAERFASPPFSQTNFVTSHSCETGLLPTDVWIFPEWWHKRQHYTKHPNGDVHLKYRTDNGTEEKMTLNIYFGSQWMALQPSFVEYLVKSLQREDSLASRLKQFLQQSRKLMTDETFIPTLLMHVVPFNDTLPKLTDEGALQGTDPPLHSIRYERMDEHSPSAFGYFWTDQRYEVPPTSKADNPKVWGPYFLGVYDLLDIKRSGALFVRKLSTEVDFNLIRLLPVSSPDEIPEIQWPKELKISEKPDWEARLKAAKEKRRKEEKIKKHEKDSDRSELRS